MWCVCTVTAHAQRCWVPLLPSLFQTVQVRILLLILTLTLASLFPKYLFYPLCCYLLSPNLPPPLPSLLLRATAVPAVFYDASSTCSNYKINVRWSGGASGSAVNFHARYREGGMYLRWHSAPATTATGSVDFYFTPDSNITYMINITSSSNYNLYSKEFLVDSCPGITAEPMLFIMISYNFCFSAFFLKNRRLH